MSDSVIKMLKDHIHKLEEANQKLTHQNEQLKEEIEHYKSLESNTDLTEYEKWLNSDDSNELRKAYEEMGY